MTYKGIGFLTEIIFREENIRKYIAQVCTEKQEKHTIGLTNKSICCDITDGNSLEQISKGKIFSNPLFSVPNIPNLNKKGSLAMPPIDQSVNLEENVTRHVRGKIHENPKPLFCTVECLRQRKYPAGTPGFGDIPPSNFKFPPQIDGSQIL